MKHSTKKIMAAVVLSLLLSLLISCIPPGNEQNVLEPPYPANYPSDSTYYYDIAVVLTSRYSGGTIFYTTDGSEPSVNSLKYTSPIAIQGLPDNQIGTRTTVIKTFYMNSAGERSGTKSYSYYICREPSETLVPTTGPIFSIKAGMYNTDLSLEIIPTISASSAIFYTLDGTTPTVRSLEYTGPISLRGDKTATLVKAVEIVEYKTSSLVSTSYYRIDYSYDPDGQKIDNLTSADYQSHMAGTTWVGYVTTPWTSAYNIEITFNQDGTYSAKSIETCLSNSGYKLPHLESALYWGTDNDSPRKVYSLPGLDTQYGANGTIILYFDGTGTGTTNDASISDFQFFHGFSVLKFKIWYEVHGRTYGPLEFTLVRIAAML